MMFRKIFAIVAALIGGGLGIAVLATGTQVAHAAGVWIGPYACVPPQCFGALAAN